MGSDHLPESFFVCLFLFSLLSKVTVGHLFPSTQYDVHCDSLIHTIFWITYSITDLLACLMGDLCLRRKATPTLFFNFADAQNAEVPWKRRGQWRVSLPGGDSRKPAKLPQQPPGPLQDARAERGVSSGTSPTSKAHHASAAHGSGVENQWGGKGLNGSEGSSPRFVQRLAVHCLAGFIVCVMCACAGVCSEWIVLP